MAKGLFGLVGRLFYPELNFEYDPGCATALDKFANGRRLEEYLRGRYTSLSSPPKDELAEVFLDFPGFAVTNFERGSLSNPKQVDFTLNLVLKFTSQHHISPKEIVLLTPYRWNLKKIDQRLTAPKYAALKQGSISNAATIDSYQGREGDIIFYLTAVTQRTGPRFTKEQRRLCAALTRQVSGLVLVGDVHVCGALDTTGKGKGKEKGGKRSKFGGFKPDGSVRYTSSSNKFKSMLEDMIARNRVVREAGAGFVEDE